MDNIRRILLVFVLFSVMVFPVGKALCSDTVSAPSLITESGFITGFGNATIHEGDYQTALLVWHLGLNLDRFFPSLKNHRGTLSFFIEPQFNPVFNPETDFEFGLGIGLQYQYPFSDRLSFYALGSMGPHYISVVTRKQENGFIFADTLGAGLYFHLTGRSALNVGYRFRHMSNADFNKPNGGIESHFGVIGYSVFFP